MTEKPKWTVTLEPSPILGVSINCVGDVMNLPAEAQQEHIKWLVLCLSLFPAPHHKILGWSKDYQAARLMVETCLVQATAEGKAVQFLLLPIMRLDNIEVVSEAGAAAGAECPPKGTLLN